MQTHVVHGIPSPRFWYSTETETEDVFFCRLLQQAGWRINIDHDLSHEVGHVGQYTYREQPQAVAV